MNDDGRSAAACVQGRCGNAGRSRIGQLIRRGPCGANSVYRVRKIAEDASRLRRGEYASVLCVGDKFCTLLTSYERVRRAVCTCCKLRYQRNVDVLSADAGDPIRDFQLVQAGNRAVYKADNAVQYAACNAL